MRANRKREEIELGLDEGITRRDFLGTSLLGSGSALLAMSSPGLLRGAQEFAALGPDWTGPGGIGDYAGSNGNTHQVVNAAHAMRDGRFRKQLGDAIDTGEEYDLVIVGGGFSGFGAAYGFKRQAKRGMRCLVLDNHPVFGGVAKLNEMEVDGYHLLGPQGSSSFTLPDRGAREAGMIPEIWDELNLPTDLEYTELAGTDKKIRVSINTAGPMMKWPERASIGYYYENDGRGQWIIDAQAAGFQNAPISNGLRQDLNAAIGNTVTPDYPRDGWERWLDGMTYKQFLVDELHLSPRVLSDYIDPYFGAASFGVSGDVVSAYGAFRLQMPGTGALVSAEKRKAFKDRDFASFPGGNTVMLRHLVKVAVPEAIRGGDGFSEIAYGRINFEALDKPDNPVRIRLSSTVVRVEHDGSPGDARKVIVTYTRNGKLYRTTARGVVMAVGANTSKYVLSDAPAATQSALGEFHHAPMLLVNVALRHWRFMERLGISAARWFQGFGWSTGIRRPMIVDGKSQPLDPSKPILLSLYVPFVNYSGYTIQQQTIRARMELLSKSYRHYELEVRRQLTRLFRDHGFEPKRDIAGIILNRWGHAYVSPQPGFYFGRNGNPAPGAIMAGGYGRVRFGHGEVTGFQSWSNCISQGRRASGEALDALSA